MGETCFPGKCLHPPPMAAPSTDAERERCSPPWRVPGVLSVAAPPTSHSGKGAQEPLVTVQAFQVTQSPSCSVEPGVARGSEPHTPAVVSLGALLEPPKKQWPRPLWRAGAVQSTQAGRTPLCSRGSSPTPTTSEAQTPHLSLSRSQQAPLLRRGNTSLLLPVTRLAANVS